MPSADQLLHHHHSLNHNASAAISTSNQSGATTRGEGEEGAEKAEGEYRVTSAAPPPASGPGANQEASLSGAIGNRGGRVALYVSHSRFSFLNLIIVCFFKS